MNWEEQFGVKLPALVAGFIGGIVALTFEEKVTFSRAMLIIFTGGVTAGYTSSLVEHFYDLPQALSGSIGFFLGLISMKIAWMAYEYVPMVIKSKIVQKVNPVINDADNTDNP